MMLNKVLKKKYIRTMDHTLIRGSFCLSRKLRKLKGSSAAGRDGICPIFCAKGDMCRYEELRIT